MERYEYIEWTDTIFENQGAMDKKRVLCVGESIVRDGMNELKKIMDDSVYIDMYASSRSLESKIFHKEFDFFTSLCKYDIIYIQTGAHHREMTIEAFRENFERLYLEIREKNKEAKIFFGLMVPSLKNNRENVYIEYNKTRIKRNNMIKELGEKHNITVIDNYSLVDGKPELKVEDGTHFTEEGHKVIAENLKKYLLED